jgi:uncharacterized protein YeaO (DUF488 family)
MVQKISVRVARVYDEPRPDDGVRVLVDRLWPRGLRKDADRFDEWVKDIAPSTDLRHWYAHQPELFDEFSARYRRELGDAEHRAALQRLTELANANRSRTVTLLTATKEVEISHLEVLKQVLSG